MNLLPSPRTCHDWIGSQALLPNVISAGSFHAALGFLGCPLVCFLFLDLCFKALCLGWAASRQGGASFLVSLELVRGRVDIYRTA